MIRKRHTADQVIRKLRDAEAQLAAGARAVRTSRRHSPVWTEEADGSISAIPAKGRQEAEMSVPAIETFGFDKQLAEHFGYMHYGACVVDGLPPSGAYTTTLVKGEGHVNRPDGSSLDYKWAFVVTNDGGLVGGFIGDSEMQSTTTVFITRDDTKDALRRCSREKKDKDELFDCIDQVLAQVVNDCEFSMSVEECRKHCWYDLQKCKARPV